MTHITARDRGRKPGTPVEQPHDMPGGMEGWVEIQKDQQQGNARGSFLVPSGAGWVEHDTLGVAEEVSRRWPNLRVAECRMRCDDCVAEGHYPYVVVELTKTGKTVAVLGLDRLDREVIDTLWAMSASHDQQRLADEHNARVRERIAKRSAEQQRASLEVIGAALKSRKFRWKGPGGITIERGMSPSKARRALTQK